MAKIAPYLIITNRFVNAMGMLEDQVQNILRAHKTRKALRPFMADKHWFDMARSEVIGTMSDVRKMKLSARERRMVLDNLRKIHKRFEPLRKQAAGIQEDTYVLTKKFLPNLIRSVERA